MNYWVHTAGRYRATCIVGIVYVTFFNCHQFNSVTYMPDEIVLARMMRALDLELDKAMHYHNEGYGIDNDYGLPAQVMRPVHIYSVSVTEASFNPADYKEAQCIISPFMPRQSISSPFCHRRGPS